MNVDIIIIGGGPAGLTAGIYALRAGKSAMVIEKNAFGGQIAQSPDLQNYPSIKSVSGLEFADMMLDQALDLGLNVELDQVTEVSMEGPVKTVKTLSGAEHTAKALIFATGAAHRRLGLEKEEELTGKGVSYCAVCDGSFYKGRTVAVVGGGNSALQEALYLANIAETVYLIHRRDSFRGEEALAEKLKSLPNVELLLNNHVTALYGEDELSGVEITDNQGISQEVTVDGLFVAVGHIPDNGLFEKDIPVTEEGYADVEEDCITPLAGVFTAGDVRKKKVRQVTTAVGDGATAATEACSYIDKNY
ncbi:MAG: FAD-dependent oxidoreductase [Parasporobacterium sp.]|nr:FAD-dependent oxidoreductase [Parasporobacterium sp.]